MKNKQSGQILPFCLLLVVILLTILVSNFEIGFLNLKKIQHQKKMDAIALTYGTNYARGLNALAALNEGLKITAQRGYMMAVVATSIAMSAQIPYSPTKIYWEMLKPKLPTFFKNLNKLGEALANQQKQIMVWMIQSHCRNSTSWMPLENKIDFFPQFSCHEIKKFKSLPFYRPEENYAEKINGVSKCRTIQINSFNEYKLRMNTLAAQYPSLPMIELTYNSQNKQNHFERPMTSEKAVAMPFSMQIKVGNQHTMFYFQKATVEYCTIFKNIFRDLSNKIPFVFNIPPPLVFKTEFFEEKNRMIFIVAESINSNFSKTNLNLFQNLPSKIWGLSEIKIEGQNFQKMEFKPRLSPISLQKKLWSNKNRYSQDWPNLQEVENEISH